MDFIVIGVVVVFFALSVGLVTFFGRLQIEGGPYQDMLVISAIIAGLLLCYLLFALLKPDKLG